MDTFNTEILKECVNKSLKISMCTNCPLNNLLIVYMLKENVNDFLESLLGKSINKMSETSSEEQALYILSLLPFHLPACTSHLNNDVIKIEN